jgi:hypothetical protein
MEGIMLGNWPKPLHPRNVRSAEFADKFVITFGEGCSILSEGNIHEIILMNLIHHSNLLIIHESYSRIELLFANLLSISGWLETSEVQGIRNLRSSGI